MNVAEYKLKVRGEGWEETPVFVVVNIDTLQDSLLCAAQADGVVARRHPDNAIAYAVASGISEAYDCEVRWNWEGSRMGHYVGTGGVEQ